MEYIKPKLKKCKGTGKAIDFGCGEPFILKRFGLCSNCWRLWLLNTSAGNEILNKSTIKAKKQVVTEKKKETREQKIENKTITVLKQEAKAPFQKLIRIRDYRKKCISCDNILPLELGAFDGGHFAKAEIYSGLILHPDNVHGQCKYCNKHLDGNEGEYSIRLAQRIGTEKYNALNKLKISLKSHKWDRYQLIELKNMYKKEIRQVEKGLKNIKDVDLTIGII